MKKINWIEAEKLNDTHYGCLDGEVISIIKPEKDVYKVFVSFMDLDKWLSKDFGTLEDAKNYIEEKFLKNMEKRLMKVHT